MIREIDKYYETAHYPSILNRIIYDIYLIRKELYNRSKHKYNLWLKRYREALRAFILILIPSWKPLKDRDIDSMSIDELDMLLEDIIRILDEKKILIRGRRIPVFDEEGDRV